MYSYRFWLLQIQMCMLLYLYMCVYFGLTWIIKNINLSLEMCHFKDLKKNLSDRLICTWNVILDLSQHRGYLYSCSCNFSLTVYMGKIEIMILSLLKVILLMASESWPTFSSQTWWKIRGTSEIQCLLDFKFYLDLLKNISKFQNVL